MEHGFEFQLPSEDPRSAAQNLRVQSSVWSDVNDLAVQQNKISFN